MNKLFFFFWISIALCLAACDKVAEKTEEVQNNANVISQLDEMAQNIQKNSEEAKAKMKERRERGDTVAMHYDKLKAFLPTAVSGYAPYGEVIGESNNVPGMSFSKAEQVYKNGDKNLTVTVLDYNGIAALYTSMIAFCTPGLSIDNQEELTKGIDWEIEGVQGCKSYKKKTREASVIMGVGGRFVVTITATNQDNTDGLEALAKSLKLSEMVKL